MNRIHSKFGTEGTVIVPTLIALVLMTTMAAILMTSSGLEHQINQQRFSIEMAFNNAEAGIDAALQEMRTGIDGSADGVGVVSGPTNGGTYSVTIAPPYDGVGEYLLTAVGVYNREQKILQSVVAPPLGIFRAGLFAGTEMFVRQDTFTDAYDSSLGTYASQAVNPSPSGSGFYALDTGSVGSNRDVIVEDGVIHGNATPGPGRTIDHSGGFIMGSTAPALVSYAMPLPPYTPTIPVSGRYRISGGNHTLSAGTYHFEEFRLDGNARLTIDGDVTLYVDSDFEVTSDARLTINPGASVVVHHEGDGSGSSGSGIFRIHNSGNANPDARPENFQVYSRGGDVEFTGDGIFYGTVYAPRARGRGHNQAQIFGAVVTDTFELDSDARFHYDRSLRYLGSDIMDYAVIMIMEARP